MWPAFVMMWSRTPSNSAHRLIAEAILFGVWPEYSTKSASHRVHPFSRGAGLCRPTSV